MSKSFNFLTRLLTSPPHFCPLIGLVNMPIFPGSRDIPLPEYARCASIAGTERAMTTWSTGLIAMPIFGDGLANIRCIKLSELIGAPLMSANPLSAASGSKPMDRTDSSAARRYSEG